jgi:hypothetical protein
MSPSCHAQPGVAARQAACNIELLNREKNMSVEGEIAAEEHHELHRALGPVQLVSLGIGAIIGAGIFVITGHAAAAYAGPGVVISFIVAGVGCLFAGLCYAEFASMIPVAGSAYTYTYATMGKFLAWIIGWNLVLEYMAAASTVAVGWSGYFVELLSQMGITIPKAFSSATAVDPARQSHAFCSAEHRHLGTIRLERRVPRHWRDLLRLYRFRRRLRRRTGSAQSAA